MDRLLEWLLKRFIRRGTLRFTTASGRTFAVGDGSAPRSRSISPPGPPNAACCSTPRSSSAKPTWTARSGRGRHHRRPAGDRARPDTRWHAAGLGSAAMVAALLLPPAAAVQPTDARAAQRRPPLRSRRPALFAVPRRRPAILLRLFREPRAIARRRATRQEAPPRRQAAVEQARAEQPRTLDIGCGWGGLALYLAEFCRAQVTGITLSQEQWQRASERAVRKEPHRRGRLPHAGLSRPARNIRPRSSRSACSSTSA